MPKSFILRDLCKELGITISALEREIGVSNGAILKSIERDSPISPLMSEKLYQKYDNLSPVWLQTGKPPIFLTSGKSDVKGSAAKSQSHSDSNDYANIEDTKTGKDMTIEMQAKALAKNSETIDRLSTSLVELMREQIELMKLFRGGSYPQSMAG